MKKAILILLVVAALFVLATSAAFAGDMVRNRHHNQHQGDMGEGPTLQHQYQVQVAK